MMLMSVHCTASLVRGMDRIVTAYVDLLHVDVELIEESDPTPHSQVASRRAARHEMRLDALDFLERVYTLLEEASRRMHNISMGGSSGGGGSGQPNTSGTGSGARRATLRLITSTAALEETSTAFAAECLQVLHSGRAVPRDSMHGWAVTLEDELAAVRRDCMDLRRQVRGDAIAAAAAKPAPGSRVLRRRRSILAGMDEEDARTECADFVDAPSLR